MTDQCLGIASMRLTTTPQGCARRITESPWATQQRAISPHPPPKPTSDSAGTARNLHANIVNATRWRDNIRERPRLQHRRIMSARPSDKKYRYVCPIYRARSSAVVALLQRCIETLHDVESRRSVPRNRREPRRLSSSAPPRRASTHSPSSIPLQLLYSITKHSYTHITLRKRMYATPTTWLTLPPLS